MLLTLNRGDFPSRTLGRHGILLREPDGFLVEILREGLDIAAVAEGVRARAGGPGMRAMLKRAGLPRLGKALG